MYNLLRVHLEGVGHGDARFDPLDLDLRGEPGTRPPDTALWLRNGGGKTSLLALFYSLLEPDRRHFLGGRNGQKKAIEHYVKGDDIAHVVAEWGRTFAGEEHLPGLGSTRQRLVTGQVMAWRRTGGKQELERHFYAFRPQPGLLEIDTLPFRQDERHRMPFQEFLGTLRRLRDEQPRLELVVTDSQRAWRQYLENAYLDPEVFRYQLVMNDDEGGAAEFLDFKDGDSFIAFLLRLVTDTTRVSQVDENISKVASLFAERPTLELELAFAKGIADHGPLLTSIRQALAEAQAELEKCRVDARALFTRLTASIGYARKEEADLETQREEVQAELLVAERERELWNGRVQALDEITARLRLELVQSALQECEAEVAKQKRATEAWALTEDRLRGRALQGQARELRAQLDADTVDSRRSYEVAAVRYRLRIRRLLATAAAQAQTAERAAKEAEGQVREAEDQIRKAVEQLAMLRARHQELQRQLEEVEERWAQMIQVGALRPGESPADALSRVEKALADADERLTQMDEAVSRLDTERSNLQAEQSKRQVELAEANAELGGLREKRTALAKRLTAMANDPDVLDAMGGVLVDVIGHAPTIRAQLMDRAAEANRDLVSRGVDAEEIQRAMAYLTSSGYLPPSRDAEQAIQMLEQNHIAASSGWQHLAENVRAAEQEGFVERVPELVTGVVVNRGDLDRALKVLGPGFIPTLPLTVAENGAWKDFAGPASDGASRRVLAPSPAYYDPMAADAAKERYSARMKDSENRRRRLQGYLERIQRLQAELGRLCEESPAEGLAFYDGRIEALEREVGVLTAQVAATTARLREIAMSQHRLNNERQSWEREWGQAKEHKVRLEVFQPQAARVHGWQQMVETVTSDIGTTATALRLAEAGRDVARAARADALRRVVEAQSNRTALQFQEQEIEVDIAGVDADVAAEMSVLPEALKQAYQAARKAYEIQMSHSETAQLLRLLEGELRTIDAVFDGKPEELLRLVDALLDRPDAATRVGRKAATSRAQEAADTAVKKLGVCEADLTLAEVNVKAKAVSVRKVDLPAELVPASYEEALAHLGDVRQQSEAAQRRRASLETELKETAGLAAAARQRIEVLSQVAKRIQPKLLGEDGTLFVDGLAESGPISVEDAKAEVEILAQALDEAEQALRASAEELRNRARSLRSFAQSSDFDLLPPVIRKAYLNEDDEGLAATAAEQAVEIEKRIVSLSDELKNLNSHRSGVVLELTDLVKEALGTLEEAQGVKLPKGLGDWSGQPYLRINYDNPGPDHVKGRIQAFVDDLIRAEKARMEGMAMLIEAVRAAVGRQPFKVTVLKPNEGLPRARATVGEIKNWSGGQKLTTALLLYCVLTRLRIKNVNRRGRSDSLASVLLLDNPIGTANLIDLVDLQLKVARELAIQLIITTGVNDYNAIKAYPNVIRLRNRKDRHSKMGYVVMETEGSGDDGADSGQTWEGTITAARVHRLVDLPAGDAGA